MPCEFLYKLGAIGRSSDGKMHPTAAGLLMFGHEYEIVKEYPNYFLDYQEQFDENNRWPAPKIEESFEPERITLSLQIEVSGDKKVAITIRKPC